jgi:dTDP-4-dehydrorhamnose 3,5-epimerase-like enzyme
MTESLLESRTLKTRGCRWIAVPGAADARGSVNFLEIGKGLDFQPRRVFWLHHVAAGQWRGRHGHRESQLVFVALNGDCLAHLDDGRTRETVRLADPTRALYMPPWVWHELTDFAPGTTVMVIASSLYEEAEYLRDYDVFRREVGEHRS